MSRVYTIGEMQDLFLTMMQEFHEYCIKNNLTYYMVGGTLLGAIRHKGFIPWDDDVDFAMPRNDYEKFIQTYAGSLKVMNYKKNKDFSFPYVKLFHKDMPVISISDAQYNVKSKMFLKMDLYPIDGVGQTIGQARRLMHKVELWKKLIYINQTSDLSTNVIKACATKIIRRIPTSLFIRVLDNRMQTFGYESSTLVTRWRMPHMLNNVVKKDVFGIPKLVKFESLHLLAPEKSDVYLKGVYGDYMTQKRENAGLRHDVNNNEISIKLLTNLKGEK